jgi:formylglycine-generating enzyme required for sulfatase activity
MERPADGMVMLNIPAGPFIMGSDNGNPDESPAHAVTLDAFWIDQTEVTNEMYKKCVISGACREPASVDVPNYYFQAPYADYPVINVNWNAASVYCTWAGSRLPSEAEWEKAARGDKEGTYPWGNIAPDSNLANYGDYSRGTTKVGSYPAGASPYGVLDMAGNIREWVNDWFDANYYSQSPAYNPPGTENGTARVIRGGAYSDSENTIRSINRDSSLPDYTLYWIGFRCAMSATP